MKHYAAYGHWQKDDKNMWIYFNDYNLQNISFDDETKEYRINLIVNEERCFYATAVTEATLDDFVSLKNNKPKVSKSV